MRKIAVILFSIIVFQSKAQDCSFTPDIDKYICLESNYETKLSQWLADYKIIMVGEMHGTNESAQFVAKLVETLSKNKEVILALEIPANELEKDSLGQIKFFKEIKQDGRSNQAIFDLIKHFENNNQVDIKAFDIKSNLDSFPPDRDKYMSEQILSLYKQYPNKTIISLSGNFHNSLDIRFDIKTMGYYLKQSFSDEKIASINISWSKGKANFNIGEGLALMDLGVKNTSCTTDFNCSTFLYDYRDKQTNYNYYLYCDTITPAFPFVYKH